MLIATKIYVTTAPLNQEYENPEHTVLPVWQFSNGAIMVLGESDPDYFFDSIDEYEPNGLDVVEDWTVSDETQDFAEEDLRDSVAQSINYYDNDEGTAKILELLASPA